MAEHRRGDKIGGSGFSLRRGPDIGLLWCKLQLPVPAPWPPVSFRQTPWPCHPRTHPWTEYQGGGGRGLGSLWNFGGEDFIPSTAGSCLPGTPPGGAGPGVKVLPSAPTPSRLESLEAAELQSTPPSSSSWFPRELRAEGGGCRVSVRIWMRKQVVWPRAPLFPARPGSLGRRGLLTGGGPSALLGGFPDPWQGFGVGATGVGNSSPQHFGGGSCAEDPEESFLCRTLKVEQVSAFGGNEKEKRGLVPPAQVCKGAGGRAPLCSPGRDTLFKTVRGDPASLCAETWTPAGLGGPIFQKDVGVWAHART